MKIVKRIKEIICNHRFDLLGKIQFVDDKIIQTFYCSKCFKPHIEVTHKEK